MAKLRKHIIIGNESTSRMVLDDLKAHDESDGESETPASTVLERNPPTKSDVEKVSTQENILEWAFCGDDATTGRLPMALFENGI